FSSRRRHTRSDRDWSSDVCSSDLLLDPVLPGGVGVEPDGRGDLLIVVAPHRDLLRLADEHELPRPGGGVDGTAGGSQGGEHGQPCAPAPGDESGHGSKDSRLAVRELPLRPPTVYGAAHETARAEGHPGHRASRPSRGGGARRLAHAGHVEKTDRLRCAGVSKEPRARPRMLRAVLRFDRRSTRSAGGLRGVKGAVWPRCGCATPLPCAHTYHRAGGGAKVLRSA